MSINITYKNAHKNNIKEWRILDDIESTNLVDFLVHERCDNLKQKLKPYVTFHWK